MYVAKMSAPIGLGTFASGDSIERRIDLLCGKVSQHGCSSRSLGGSRDRNQRHKSGKRSVQYLAGTGKGAQHRSCGRVGVGGRDQDWWRAVRERRTAEVRRSFGGVPRCAWSARDLARLPQTRYSVRGLSRLSQFVYATSSEGALDRRARWRPSTVVYRQWRVRQEEEAEGLQLPGTGD